MINYALRFRVFAMCLAALAGFVDAMGFVLTGGLFVSFMSGNSTRMAVGLAGGSGVAFYAGALVASFLAGVVSGALIAHWKGGWRKAVVMAFTTTVLMLAAVLLTLGYQVGAALVFAAAMGSLNNVFLREGEVSIGVTYMTGALVRAGQRIASKNAGPWRVRLAFLSSTLGQLGDWGHGRSSLGECQLVALFLDRGAGDDRHDRPRKLV